MNREMIVVGSVPKIADGNPSTLMAIAASAEREGVDFHSVELRAGAFLAKLFHESITNDPANAFEHMQTSETERKGAKGFLYGKLSGAEFAGRKRNSFGDSDVQWNVVQELPLRHMSKRMLKNLNIVDVRLIVPDVYPKLSGVDALEKHKTLASASVWNADAQEELANLGLKADLHRPYLLDGLRPDNEEFYKQGRAIVVKTSGSGAPYGWVEELGSTLRKSGIDHSIHTPEHSIINGKKRYAGAGFKERTETFYGSLGGNTQILIGYPSELVGVAFEMRQRGVPVVMLTLPPRSMHELRNLEFGYKYGVVLAELDLRNSHRTSGDIPVIKPADMVRLLDESFDEELPKGLIGEKSLWS